MARVRVADGVDPDRSRQADRTHHRFARQSLRLTPGSPIAANQRTCRRPTPSFGHSPPRPPRTSSRGVNSTRRS